eukprot:365296-Chlamydomonas_euryale.AAC.5
MPVLSAARQRRSSSGLGAGSITRIAYDPAMGGTPHNRGTPAYRPGIPCQVALCPKGACEHWRLHLWPKNGPASVSAKPAQNSCSSGSHVIGRYTSKYDCQTQLQTPFVSVSPPTQPTSPYDACKQVSATAS